ncbi:MBL fold metallo-hydrolase [Cupriavidus oxalaticus]|uniref:MBL fold metallo-hydrolase n=2 Tax=Cupriavidus oxalaticus TaxID=96344 RepID=A0A375FIP4_9BURK|nr:MBL fold metallo-hydrolase [Cupriavidus oxalaticus]QRQ91619.1 MBL fold metallo-hydrolase [Cupriavidus oxalaticus]SPC05104.1 putative Zinc phosphodiesterase, tRNA 3' processing RNase Z homolog [Cupriavidus oxalaticus]SPC18187.1 putative Zinc phosphodiesterase, tRNA 3' processing RNase Z homolog [Cupriavidus oxalaticus]
MNRNGMRVSWRRASSAALLAACATICVFSPTAAAQQASAPAGARAGAHLVLLGTSGGRTSWRGVQAAGISSAVVVNGQVYLVDFGAGWLRRYFQAGLGAPPPARGLESLRAAFITHLHADHVVDYPSLVLFGASDGLSERKTPVRVFGPGARGKLPPVSGSTSGVSAIVSPESPTPGTLAMTESMYRAFATDINDNILESRKPNPHTRVEVQDIAIPAQADIDPNTNPAPDMAPFPVYQDENVKVTATLVSHPPVYPSFAFRFDTAEGSVVFSGDTSPSRNLIRLAQGADVLVHEVIDTAWVDALYPKPRNAAQEAKAHHLVHSHTAVEDVGAVAQAANVKVLVLSHLAPADNAEGRWARAKEGFSGDVLVGKDLQWIPLRAKSRTNAEQ